MSNAALTAQPATTIQTRAHVPDVVRGAMVLVALGVLTKFTALNEHMVFGAASWVAYIASMALGLAVAARIFRFDVSTPIDGPLRVERTRQTSIVQEIVIAGGGALIALAPAAYLIATISQERWAGQIEDGSELSIVGLAFALFFGAMGTAMVAFRPQFTLDRAKGTIVRHAFGRSFPIKVETLPYADLVVYSEGYFMGNGGVRLGDVIRGRVGGYTFELERVRGNLAPEVVREVATRWASTLGARYLTPQQAAVAELGS